MKSVLQDWVMELGLRHQGVLLTAVRGCDTAPKDDPSKMLVRCLRNEFLNCHNGDPSKAVSFIEQVDEETLKHRMRSFLKNHDHYPWHYMAHLLHASEIVAYHHTNTFTRTQWYFFYSELCRAFHLNPESPDQLNIRLNANEETFGKNAEIR